MSAVGGLLLRRRLLMGAAAPGLPCCLPAARRRPQNARPACLSLLLSPSSPALPCRDQLLKQLARFVPGLSPSFGFQPNMTSPADADADFPTTAATGERGRGQGLLGRSVCDSSLGA